MLISGSFTNLFWKLLSLIGYFINFYTPIKWLIDKINFSSLDDLYIETDIFFVGVPECGMEFTFDLIERSGIFPVLLDPWVPWMEALVQAIVVIS